MLIYLERTIDNIKAEVITTAALFLLPSLFTIAESFNIFSCFWVSFDGLINNYSMSLVNTFFRENRRIVKLNILLALQ